MATGQPVGDREREILTAIVETFISTGEPVGSRIISRNVGVAVAASGPKNALEHVYFSRLGDQKVLAVLVTKSGVVRDRVMRLDLSQADLDAAARFINDNFRGWTLEAVRGEIARRL